MTYVIFYHFPGLENGLTKCHDFPWSGNHHKVPALSPRCIWHVGTTQDLEDTVYSPCVKCGSQKNHWLFTLSHLVTNRRLWLFGHIACSSPREDHHRAIAACIRQVPPDWKWPAGRPSHIWLRAIEADLGPLNFGLATAWRKATTQDEWRHIVDTATLQWSTLWKKKKGTPWLKDERQRYLVATEHNYEMQFNNNTVRKVVK